MASSASGKVPIRGTARKRLLRRSVTGRTLYTATDAAITKKKKKKRRKEQAGLKSYKWISRLIPTA